MKRRTDIKEVELVKQAARFCSNRTLAIDGGANAGIFTEAMLRYFDMVLSVEPVTKTYDELRKRFEKNDRVFLCKQALWNESGVLAHMAHPRKRTTSTSFYLTTKEKNSEHAVCTAAIDHFRFPEVSLIKLDIEGAEFNALLGAHKTIARSRPVIIVECVDKQLKRYGHSIDEMHNWLCEHGYGLRTTHGVNRLYVSKVKT